MNNIFMLMCVLLTACASNLSTPTQTENRLLYQYESSAQCKECHIEQYQEYSDSMHAKAFANPLFSAQYFNEVVPRAQRDPRHIPEARKCIACHAPVVFMNYTGLVSSPAQANRFETGVTCDFCHTLVGFAENGDYKQEPSGKKQGPYQITGSTSLHSEYSGYMQVGDFCGRCHNATSHFGLKTVSTYDEWRKSGYGIRGVVCQECHMNKDGFLKNGNAEFTQGRAAYMSVGGIPRKQKEHDKLYNHSFPGAHSDNELEGALRIEFRIGNRRVNQLGLFPISVLLDNERSGHKMPTGSSDLRLMWLIVTATAADGTNIPVVTSITKTNGKTDFSIAGASPDDAAILQNDVPAGSRLYRTVQVDSSGRQSLFQYDAVKNIFDSRLEASEVRKEAYYLKPPANYSGNVTLEARLYYRGAPSSFTKRMQVPDFTPVLVASQKKQILIESPVASNKK
jgi:hypothetical protein